MATYITVYMPDQPGVWLATDYDQPLNFNTISRYCLALDEDALEDCNKARIRAELHEEEIVFQPNDRVYVLSNASDDDNSTYRLYYYKGTPSEYYDNMTEDRERRAKLKEESDERARQREADSYEKERIKRIANTCYD